MSWAGGLLTVAGKTGEGGFKGVNKNIDEAIEEKKAAALEKRLLNLEKVKAGYRAEENRLGQSATAEQNRLQQGATAAENKAEHIWKEKQSGATGQEIKDMEDAFGSEGKQLWLDMQTAKTQKERNNKMATMYLKAADVLTKDPAQLSAVNEALSVMNADKHFVLDEKAETFELVPVVHGKMGDGDNYFKTVLERIPGVGSNKTTTKKPGLLEQPKTLTEKEKEEAERRKASQLWGTHSTINY